jgi:2-amino-4-hydroxy-6-hydroxymethyldihydropteridine diphosphokinase
MVDAYIGLGANLGDAAAALAQATKDVARLPGTAVIARSSLYRTAPITTADGAQVQTSGEDYFNAVLRIETSLPAPVLLQHLLRIELSAGRERPYLHAPRTLDLDLLMYGSGHIESPHLTVPHPRMWQRAFVLVPLAEIAPGLVSAAQLAAVAQQRIERLDRPSDKD